MKEYWITVKEMNEIMYRTRNAVKINRRYDPDFDVLSVYVFWHLGKKKFEIWLNENDKRTHYMTYLDEEQLNPWDVPQALPSQSYAELQRYWKCPDYDKYNISAAPFLWYNEKYNNKRTRNVIGYDLNKAYLSALTKDLPDTTRYVGSYRIVGEDEIGISEIGEDKPGVYVIREVGEMAEIVYKRQPSPYLGYVEMIDKKLKRAKAKDDKCLIRKLKEKTNFAIGMMQHHNPIMRAFIIGHVNRKMFDLIDKNTLYCNTDSIVSLVPREDLEIDADKIGSFKIEHQGDFAYVGYNLQWNKDKPKIRGKAKSWIKEDYDLLKDGPIISNNFYKLNIEQWRIDVNEN